MYLPLLSDPFHILHLIILSFTIELAKDGPQGCTETLHVLVENSTRNGTKFQGQCEFLL